MSDRYGSDVLAGDWKKPKHGRAVETPAELGAVVEAILTTDPSTSSGHRFVGEIVRIDRDLHTLTLEDRHGKRRTFPLGPGFWLEGKPVILTPPVTRAAPAAPTRTASGSVAVAGVKARVARESRIFVEGRHDAELVEKIWGDDLRIEGVVVEYLGGVDDLADHLVSFRPGPERRVGVLVDHLVKRSKEARIAESIRRSAVGQHVLIVGHPFIDVWQAVKPARLGLEAWPSVPRSVEWKKGICQHMGWPHRDQADIARAWKHILGRVNSFGDLEPELLGRVEELIDFVTEPV
ncbi:DUF3097 domain-containing protein [Nocardioides sp. NPDC057767]|uniref:DUF3097 domain-containing protein n=1 Tax=unclassified Nocardioides TaxID=2615069 RepID=UPI00366F75BE